MEQANNREKERELKLFQALVQQINGLLQGYDVSASLTLTSKNIGTQGYLINKDGINQLNKMYPISVKAINQIVHGWHNYKRELPPGTKITNDDIDDMVTRDLLLQVQKEVDMLDSGKHPILQQNYH